MTISIRPCLYIYTTPPIDINTIGRINNLLNGSKNKYRAGRTHPGICLIIKPPPLTKTLSPYLHQDSNRYSNLILCHYTKIINSYISFTSRYKTASCMTFFTAVHTQAISFSPNVGCTRNIRLVSPSSFATGNLSIGS